MTSIPSVLVNETMPTSTSKITDTLKKYWWVIIILIVAYLFYKNQQAKKIKHESQKQ
jgi:hypothetical protein